jgi:transposase
LLGIAPASQELEPPTNPGRFTAGLQQDGKAVRAALATPWSNGQSEGHITKLKLLKREMYGQANFDLLRRRELLAA